MVTISPRITLPVLPDVGDPHVPPHIPFENYGRLLEHIAVAVRERIPVLLIGETGTGKTSLVRYLAHLTRHGFRRANHNGATTVEDIVGKILVNKDGTYWVDGVLTDAMRKGHWYLADEMNASSADINFVYHSLLDDDGYIVLPENNGEIVRPHPEFRFFGAINPSSDYTGTKEMNRALLSRFAVVRTDFPPPKTEVKIIAERTGIKSTDAERMVRFAVEVRENHAKGKFQFVLSTRDLIQWAMWYKVYGKFITSAELAFLNKVSPDDFDAVKDLVGMNFKSIDAPPSKTKTRKKEGTHPTEETTVESSS